jgi:hypothetical protein
MNDTLSHAAGIYSQYVSMSFHHRCSAVRLSNSVEWDIVIDEQTESNVRPHGGEEYGNSLVVTGTSALGRMALVARQAGLVLGTNGARIATAKSLQYTIFPKKKKKKKKSAFVPCCTLR